MPYYFGEDDPGWEEQDAQPLHVAQFRYLPPPDIGGAHEPVRFGDHLPAAGAASASPAPRAPSLHDRLLGRTPRRPTASVVLTWEERQRQEEIRARHLLALLVVALRDIGVRRAYCRYDGGNDEGFAWLDHIEMKTGERLAAEVLCARLTKTNLRDRLVAAGLVRRRSGQIKAREMRDIVRDVLAVECAALLLGRGFGTGPFCMYGAFTVDLDACTIVDDRNAEPIVENFSIRT